MTFVDSPDCVGGVCVRETLNEFECVGGEV